ncbi:MAG: hypothetical protein KDE05_12985 [Parvularculaceae bacterium]|nr:hypothetical protein [Parvularculaceae bacterium]
MLIRTGIAFQAFKYAIYALLAINTAAFFSENFASVSHTYKDGLQASDIIVAYADAIDAAAWLVLLLMLELETFVIPDEKLKGWTDRVITTVSFACWALILYSLYGYVASLGEPYGYAPYAGGDPCGAVKSGASLALGLDDYAPLDAGNCKTLVDGAWVHQSHGAFISDATLGVMKRLAWTDVVNAAVWVLIVVILELEIYLKSSKLFGTRFFFAYKGFKVFLYAILLVDVYYWWALGDPLDAWDAFLWLVAFFFIEMNMLSWQEETAKKRAAGQIA